MSRTHIRLIVAGAALALLPSSLASAQAWVNAKGELSLSLRSDYQTSQGVWHGSELVTGLPVQALNNALSVEYVPLEHLGLGVSINSNGVRYTGPQTIPNQGDLILSHGTQDDGSFHWSLTDLELDARYQAYDGAVTLTPVIHARIPVTDYEQKGYGAAGSNLAEGSVGLAIGRYGLGIEDLVLQLGYTFTYVEKESGGGDATEQYRVNRSDADLSLAYVITDKLIVGAGAGFRYTHDGFDLTEYPNLAMGSSLIQWHDPVLRARYLAPAVVASYQISDAWSLAGRFAAVVWGENVSNPFSFGLTVGWANNLAD